MADHSVLSAALRRYVDPAESNDPRVRDLVSRLARLDPAPPLRADFRAELRTQLVAVAPRLVAEGTGEPAAPASERRRFQLHLGRPLAAIAGATAVLLFLLGGAVWISGHALPGDTLYGLKRASEDVRYSLSSGATDRSKELLAFAKTRSQEVADLVPASSSGHPVSSSTATLVTSTLASADDDVRRAAQMLGADAVHSASASPLSVMTSWAPGQLARLKAITSHIPAGSLHNRAAASAALVSAALARAQALAGETGCACLQSAATDDLGPVPCVVANCLSTTAPSAPLPGLPGPSASASASGRTGTTGHAGAPGHAGTTTTTRGGSHSTGPATVGTSTSPNPLPSLPGVGGLPLPTPSLPITLPTSTLPKLPVGVNSCGLHVTLGPIGLNLGTCTSH